MIYKNVFSTSVIDLIEKLISEEHASRLIKNETLELCHQISMYLYFSCLYSQKVNNDNFGNSNPLLSTNKLGTPIVKLWNFVPP